LQRSIRRYAPYIEGKVCSTIVKLYNEDAIVVEPAGALSIAALDDFANEIKY
jgi:threonine dehydratase